MANNIGEDIDGKVVVIDAATLRIEFADSVRKRLFLVQGGYGAYAATAGRKMYGTWLIDGEESGQFGDCVERLATYDEIKDALAQATPPDTIATDAWLASFNPALRKAPGAPVEAQ